MNRLGKIVSILLVLFFVFRIYSNDDNYLNIYNKVLSEKTPFEKYLDINFDNLTLNQLIDIYIDFSLDTNQKNEIYYFIDEKFKLIEKSLLEEYKTINISFLDKNGVLKFTESINTFMHKIIFQRYDERSYRFSDLLKYGKFNCVSSSIIYALLLKKFGIKFVGVETADHVFIQVDINGENIDVETTNIYGFDPGTKKEFYDSFGRITGYTYVPQKNYKDRNNINLKNLFGLVIHNHISFYTSNYDYFNALKYAIFYHNYRNDEKSYKDLISAIGNFVKYYSLNKKFLISYNLLNEFIKNYSSPVLLELKAEIINDLIINSNNLTEIENYFQEIEKIENSSGSNRINSAKFELIKENISIKLADLNAKNRNFSKAIFYFTKIKNSKNRETVLNNIYYFISTGLNSYNDFEDALKQIENVGKQINERNLYSKYRFIIINNYTVFLLKNSDYEKVFQLLENEYKYNYSSEVMNLYKNSINNISYSYYQKNDFVNAINSLKRGLNILGNDRVILNNLKFYYEKYMDFLDKNSKNDEKNLIYNEYKKIFN